MTYITSKRVDRSLNKSSIYIDRNLRKEADIQTDSTHHLESHRDYGSVVHTVPGLHLHLDLLPRDVAAAWQAVPEGEVAW